MIDDLPRDIRLTYRCLRELPDGRIIGVHRLLFHWTLHVGIDLVGYETRYCFDLLPQVMKAFALWDGVGDPPGGWHKHPDSGRCRIDGDPDAEYMEWDYPGELAARARLREKNDAIKGVPSPQGGLENASAIVGGP